MFSMKRMSNDLAAALEQAASVAAPVHQDGVRPRAETVAPTASGHSEMPTGSLGFFTFPGQTIAPEPKPQSVADALMEVLKLRASGVSVDLQKLADMEQSGELPVLAAYDKQAILEVTENFSLENYPHTQAGLRRLFLDLYGHRIRYSRDTECSYAFDDARGIWVENRGDYIEDLAGQTIWSLGRLRSCIEDESELKSFEGFWNKMQKFSVPSSLSKSVRSSRSVGIRANEFDDDPLLISLENCVYGLRDGAPLSPDPRYNISKTAPVAFDPGADCPNFKRILADSLSGDTDTIEYVQRLLGYCLSGDSEAKKYWILNGPSDCGKTTIIKVMKAILGTEEGYWGNLIHSTLQAGGGDDKNLGLASLHGKERLVTMDELPLGYCFDGGKLKSVTGFGAGVSMRINFRSFISREITFKLVIATNHLPAYDSADSGIASRAVVIPFNKQFPRVMDFDKQWQSELPGILNWLLKGYDKYLVDGLENLPPVIAAATQAHVQGSDPLSDFLKQETKRIAGAEAMYGVDDVRKRFNAWLIAQGKSTRPASHNDFSKMLRDKGYTVEHRKNRHLNHCVGVDELRFTADDSASSSP